jgi:hypothetical protein
LFFNPLKKEEERKGEREHEDTINRNVVRDIAFYWEAGDDTSAMNIPKQYTIALLVKLSMKEGKAMNEMRKVMALSETSTPYSEDGGTMFT